jgi:predicted PurR-regulated permease PerM
VSGYVAGNIGISVIAGLVAYITLTLLGVGFAAPLAVIVGVFDLLRSSAPRSPRSSLGS